MDEFGYASLGNLIESESNPRRYYNENALQELADSIRQKGVLENLLVRPITGIKLRVQRGVDEMAEKFFVTNDLAFGEATEERPVRIYSGPWDDEALAHGHMPVHEIVAGSRRFRAAKIAGAVEVPIRVRDFTDEEVFEVQTIENMQREGVHPMDEAVSMQAYVERTGCSVEELCLRIGKKEDYVRMRLKLNDLIENARKAFWEDEMLLGHALLLARLKSEYQEQLLAKMKQQSYTVGALRLVIAREILMDLAKAPFDTADASLIEKAGACTECHKRTGFTPALFPDIGNGDTCTDKECFQSKCSALIEREIKKFKANQETLAKISSQYAYYGRANDGIYYQGQWKNTSAKACGSVVKGIWVDGEDLGKIVNVCVDQKCSVHAGVTRCEKSDAEKAREAAARLQAKKDTRLKQLKIQAIAEPVSVNTFQDSIPLVFSSMLNRAWEDTIKELHKHLGLERDKSKSVYGATQYMGPIKEYLKGVDADEIARLTVVLAVMQNGDVLQEAVKVRKIDLKEISTQVESEFARPEKKSRKAKPKE